MCLQIDSLKNRERFIGQMNLFLNEEFPGLTITDQRMFERSGRVCLTIYSILDTSVDAIPHCLVLKCNGSQ